MPAKRGRGTANEWTTAEEDLIRSMRESGAKVKDIAEAIGRTENAVRLRINKMNAGEKVKVGEAQPDPVEPEEKHPYRVTVLVDGCVEKPCNVTAGNPHKAGLKAKRKLMEMEPLRSFDVVKVESLDVPDPITEARVKKFAEILDSVNAGAKANTLKAPELVKEIQDGIDEVVQACTRKGGRVNGM